MPNYEYECTECTDRFELWQNVGDPAPECPKCGSAVKKVFHVPRVIFKGSGFYVTDLRAEKEGKSGGSKAATETKAEKTTDTSDSKDAKPATTSDSSSAKDAKPAAAAATTGS